MQAHRLHIKVAEFNTPSDGNGITGIPIAVFFNEMENKKKKKWEIKRRTKLCKLSQLHAFSFFKCKFEKFLMTAKAMCLSIKVAQLNTFRLEKLCAHGAFPVQGAIVEGSYENRWSLKL